MQCPVAKLLKLELEDVDRRVLSISILEAVHAYIMSDDFRQDMAEALHAADVHRAIAEALVESIKSFRLVLPEDASPRSADP